MGKYWLMDRHGAEGPSVLVETDGSMKVVDVLRFGPSVDELDDQQKLVDDVIGRVAPTLKPMILSSKLKEQGIAPHAELQHAGGGGGGNRNGRRKGGAQATSSGQAAGGPKRTGGRGRG